MNKGLEALKELDEHCITWHDNPTKEKIKIIEKELKDAEELDKYLDFSDGALMSGFEYKGQQIVAMPLEECDKLMKKDEALVVLKDLFDFDFALRFPSNQPMLRIENKRTNEYWEIPVAKEKYDLLKEITNNE